MTKKLFVANLAYSTSEKELESAFSQAGTVQSVHIPIDLVTGRKRGFGLVEMQTAEQAESAVLQFNGMTFNGRQITVKLLQPRDALPKTYGRKIEDESEPLAQIHNGEPDADAKPRSKRNPPWSRDELILALDLYLSRGLLDDRAPEVVDLSDCLRQLAAVEQNNPEVFRNPNGVAMKLGNFAALDPGYSGKGLSAGGKGDRAIWKEFAQAPPALVAAAIAIRARLGRGNVVSKLVEAESNDTFKPDDVGDTRVRLVSSIVSRRGQGSFRQALLEAYGGRCAFSGYDAPDALEAAHILGYMGKESNHVCNGLLLRADLHTLFDLGLIAVQSNSMTIVVAAALRKTLYAILEGQRIISPIRSEHEPSKAALDLHFRASRCLDLLSDD